MGAADGGGKTVPVGLLFPGQGSQYVKMLSTVRDIPKVQELLKKADDILGYSITELCLKGPESRLEETAYCQPAMFIAGLAGIEKAKLEALCKEAGELEGKGAVCKIANELFPKGFSCAGTEAAIMKLKDLSDKAGALQAKVLKTSGGFHTEL